MRRLACLLTGLIVACSTGPPATDPAPAPADTAAVRARGLEYSAVTRDRRSFPVQLHTTVTVRNTGTQRVHLEVPGGCPVLLRAYRLAEPARIRWNQANAIVCTLQLQLVDIDPGQTAEFTGRTDAGAILGDSLPDGVYHFRAAIAVNDTTIVIPAGSAHLAIAR